MARNVTEAEIMRARSKGKRSTVALDPEDFKGGEPGGSALPQGGWSNGPGKVVMYQRGPWGWRPREIMANLVDLALEAGDLPHCGDCGSDQCGVREDPQTGELAIDSNPNHCEGKPNIATRRCPVCRKAIFDIDTAAQIRDMRMNESVTFGDEDDPNEIKDDIAVMLTPEARTRASLEEHLEWVHPREARAILGRALIRDSINASTIPRAVSLAEAAEMMGAIG